MLQCEHFQLLCLRSFFQSFHPSSPGLHVVQAQEHSAALLQHLQAEQRHEEERRISVVEQLQERRKVGIIIIVMIMIIMIMIIIMIIVIIIDIAVSRRRSRGSPLSNICRRDELLLQERVYRRGDFWVSRRSPGAGRRRRRRRKGRRARSRRIRKRRGENSQSFRDQPLP